MQTRRRVVSWMASIVSLNRNKTRKRKNCWKKPTINTSATVQTLFSLRQPLHSASRWTENGRCMTFWIISNRICVCFMENARVSYLRVVYSFSSRARLCLARSAALPRSRQCYVAKRDKSDCCSQTSIVTYWFTLALTAKNRQQISKVKQELCQ